MPSPSVLPALPRCRRRRGCRRLQPPPLARVVAADRLLACPVARPPLADDGPRARARAVGPRQRGPAVRIPCCPLVSQPTLSLTLELADLPTPACSRPTPPPTQSSQRRTASRACSCPSPRPPRRSRPSPSRTARDRWTSTARARPARAAARPPAARRPTSSAARSSSVRARRSKVRPRIWLTRPST